MDERKCEECAHFVVKDVKHNYCQIGCGTYDQYIYGCEVWECNFKEKGKVESEVQNAYSR